MNAPDRLSDWSVANQRLLVAEFTRLRALLGDGDAEAAAREAAALREGMSSPPAIDTLAQVFQLSDFERDVLLLVAGVEMDARVAAMCARCSGQLQRPWASFGLALAALPEAHWSALAPLEPLRRWCLVDVDEAGGLAAGRLHLDERVLHFIGGLNYLDHRLQALFDPVASPGPMSAAHSQIALRAAEQLRAARGRLRVLLCGDDAAGQEDIAAAIAAQFGLNLYRLRAADVPAAAGEQAALAALWTRESVLLGACLLVTYGEIDADAALSRWLARIDGLAVVAGRELPGLQADALRFSVDRPGTPERRELWQNALGARAEALAPALDGLASQYRLGARRIFEIASRVAGDDVLTDIAVLHLASRGDVAPMPGLAQRIDSRVTWDDLVLPDSQREALRQIAVHTRHRLTVHYDWGFAGKSARGLGIAALFWGDSGTGKTLAAEVLAHELDLALYRIDLSAVVSKYIGETEKNLRRVFDAAEDAGAILLFDEADALFGKRSEVKDSHDRYANIEVSYLLQRMEAYSGLAILTTNHKTALDPAFQRRLRFVVHFPFPDQTQRAAIWRAAFPPGAPLDGIDYAKLARLNVAGGTIRNIALSAAFLAAEANLPLGMGQLLRSVHFEAAKRDSPHSDAETRGWI
jgi:hypothetical protein